MSRLMVLSMVVAAVLAATIGLEIQSTPQYRADNAPGQPAPSNLVPTMPIPAPTDPVEAWVSTALERPLLREGRRPERASGTVAKKGDDTPRLAGVVTGPFGDRAIFVLPGIAKPVVANVGAQLSDFVVRSIEPGRVVVEANGIVRIYKPMYSGVNRKQVVALRRS